MANGLYNNEELIDTLIIDCNNAVNAIIANNGIQWCKIMLDMVVKLANLKTGIKSDLANREETIDKLIQTIRDMGGSVENIEMEATNNGSN